MQVAVAWNQDFTPMARLWLRSPHPIAGVVGGGLRAALLASWACCSMLGRRLLSLGLGGALLLLCHPT